MVKRLVTFLVSLALTFAVAVMLAQAFLRLGVGAVTASVSYIRKEMESQGWVDAMDAAQDISGKWHLDHTEEPDLVIQFSIPQDEFKKLNWIEDQKSWLNVQALVDFFGRYGIITTETYGYYIECGKYNFWAGTHSHIYYTWTPPNEIGMVDVYSISVH